MQRYFQTDDDALFCRREVYILSIGFVLFFFLAIGWGLSWDYLGKRIANQLRPYCGPVASLSPKTNSLAQALDVGPR